MIEPNKQLIVDAKRMAQPHELPGLDVVIDFYLKACARGDDAMARLWASGILQWMDGKVRRGQSAEFQTGGMMQPDEEFELVIAQAELLAAGADRQAIDAAVRDYRDACRQDRMGIVIYLRMEICRFVRERWAAVNAELLASK